MAPPAPDSSHATDATDAPDATVPSATDTATSKSPRLRFAAASVARYPAALSLLASHRLAAYISHSAAILLCTRTYRVIRVLPLRSPPNSILLVHDRFHDSTPPVLAAASLSGQLFLATPSSHAPDSAHSLHESSILALSASFLPQRSESTLLVASVCQDALCTTAIANPARGSAVAAPLARLPLSAANKSPPLLAHALALCKFCHDAHLVALAGTDRHIHLYLASHGLNPSLEQLARIPAHQNWVRSLAFSPTHQYPLLASASSDGTARLFRIAPLADHHAPQPRSLQFQADGAQWAVRPAARLDEHEAAVQTVAFDGGAGHDDKYAPLLTASLDGTLAIWALEEDGDDRAECNVRARCIVRFGLLGGHSVYAPGFFAAVLCVRGADNDYESSQCDGYGERDDEERVTVLAASFSGALHRWTARSIEARFASRRGVGGHVGAVHGVAWAARRNLLLSVGADKTARVYAARGDGLACGEYVEWARPQVHGHAIFAAEFLGTEGRRLVSGGEERMLRVFEAPDAFVRSAGDGRVGGEKGGAGVAGAVLPVLGLSNKVVRSGGDDGDGPGEGTVTAMGAERGSDLAPLEEELKQATLWPECAKLYGHANEIAVVRVCERDGAIASACRAWGGVGADRDAQVIIWEADSGREVARLGGHERSVCDMRFEGRDGQRLVSVGRDRRVVVHERADGASFRTVGMVEGAHARGVHAVAWIRAGVFATGGRDRWVKVFRVGEGADGQREDSVEVREIGKQRMAGSVTAMDCVYEEGVVAIGMASGAVEVVRVSVGEEGVEWTEVGKGVRWKCGGAVNALRFRPDYEVGGDGGEGKGERWLAIGSEDGAVCIVSFADSVKR